MLYTALYAQYKRHKKEIASYICDFTSSIETNYEMALQ